MDDATGVPVTFARNSADDPYLLTQYVCAKLRPARSQESTVAVPLQGGFAISAG
jgi:hypothetical protein